MQLADLKWTDVKALSPDTPVVFPVAAHEQHGHHMPLHTDSLLLGEIVQHAEEHVGSDILFAPLQWLGNSHHHMDFPGTMSAEPRTYLDMLTSNLKNFIKHGFKRLVLLNGHGGNMVPGSQVVFELRQKLRDRHDLLLLSTTYWDNGQPTELRDDFVQTQMGHAGEWETSMMLIIRPELVGDHPQFWRGQGCPACLGTGYQGRLGIYELLTPSDEIRQLILQNVDSNTIKQKAKLQGMRTLREDGAQKVLAGITSSAEVLRVTAEG